MLLGRDLWRLPSPAFGSKQGNQQHKIRSAVALPRQIYTFWHGGSALSPGDLSLCCTSLPVNGHFLTSTVSHPNCSTSPLPLVYQLALLTGVWLHCLCDSPPGTHQNGIIAQLPLHQIKQAQLPQLLFAGPLTNFLPCWLTFSSFPVSLLTWRAQNWIQYCSCALTNVEMRWITTFLHLAMSSKGSLLHVFPYLQWEYTLAHSQLGIDRTPPDSFLVPWLAEACQDLLAASQPLRSCPQWSEERHMVQDQVRKGEDELLLTNSQKSLNPSFKSQCSGTVIAML